MLALAARVTLPGFGVDAASQGGGVALGPSFRFKPDLRPEVPPDLFQGVPDLSQQRLQPITQPAALGLEPELAQDLFQAGEEIRYYSFESSQARPPSVIAVSRHALEELENGSTIAHLEEVLRQLLDERRLILPDALALAGALLASPSISGVCLTSKVYPYSLLDETWFRCHGGGVRVERVKNKRTLLEWTSRICEAYFQALGFEAMASSSFIKVSLNEKKLFAERDKARFEIQTQDNLNWDAFVADVIPGILAQINNQDLQGFDVLTRWALNAFDGIDFISPDGKRRVAIAKSSGGEHQAGLVNLFAKALFSYLQTAHLEADTMQSFVSLLGLVESSVRDRRCLPQFEQKSDFVWPHKPSPFVGDSAKIIDVPRNLLALADGLSLKAPQAANAAREIARHIQRQINSACYATPFAR